MRAEYDFPVALQPTFTQAGKEVPKARAVVRLDTEEPIANVSTRYALVPHKQMVHHAQTFIRNFGEPQVKHFLDRNGAMLTSEYTFRERTVPIQKGDIVGLRIWTRSNYSGTGSNYMQIGGLRLVCLNGMVRSETTFELGFRHTEKAVTEFQAPHPDEVLQAFQTAGKEWHQLAKLEFPTEAAYNQMAERAVEEFGILPQKALTIEIPKENEEHPAFTAWKLYNRFTYYVNHAESKAASYNGKLRRLNGIDRFFREVVMA